VSFDLFDNKVTVRLNLYETSQTSVVNSTLTAAVNAIISLHTQSFNSVKSNFNADRGDGFPVNYIAPPQALLALYNVSINNGTISTANPGVNETSDYVAKGEELELLLRPTRGLSLILNVARQESVRSNSGARLRELLYDVPAENGQPLIEAWRSTAADNVALFVGATPGSTAVLKGVFERDVLNRFTLITAGDNGTAAELREWRVNGVANYRFSEGRFKGYSLGGAVRWEDKVAIGYPLTTIEVDGSPSDGIPEANDIRLSDVSNPHFGPDLWNFDAWIGYERKIFHDRIGLKVQLNVRNLFNDDDPIPVQAQPDGSIAGVRVATPRTFALTTRFTF
jgi:hypothetical protein